MRIVEGNQTDSPEEELEKQGCYDYEPSSKSIPKTDKSHDQQSFDALIYEPRNDHFVIFQATADVDPAYEIKSESQAKTQISFQRRYRCV